MLRKLLFCTMFLLFLLTACRPTKDTAIFCGEHWSENPPNTTSEYLVYELHTTGSRRLLSRWADQYLSWQAPYLFHLNESGDAWQLSSTAADGTSEQIWLDSARLPEAYQAYTAWGYGMRYVDGVLYLPCRGDTADVWLVAAITSDGSVGYFPLEYDAFFPLIQIQDNQLYYISYKDRQLIALDLRSGVSRSVTAYPPQGSIDRSFFYLDNGILWHLLTDPDTQTTTLLGVDAATGDTRAAAQTTYLHNEWVMDTSRMYIHDGYAYYFHRSYATGKWDLWEVPLTALMDGTCTWEALFAEGGPATPLAWNVSYHTPNPPAALCSGHNGLWLCYDNAYTETPATYFNTGAWSHASGEVRYISDAH